MKNPILTQLAIVAPFIAFNVSRGVDPHFRWDGDGPDPAEEGYEACDVDVDATTILNGQLVKGTASLGGSYFKHDEPCGDVHGYLLQMLDEALSELLPRLTNNEPMCVQAMQAKAMIKAAMRRAYDEQMRQA